MRLSLQSAFVATFLMAATIGCGSRQPASHQMTQLS
jgi:hypothetical protein